MFVVTDGEAKTTLKYDSIEGVKKYLADRLEFSDEDYDDLLDSAYDEFDIFGKKYSPSYVLKRVDPLVYDESRDSWIELHIEDYIYELEHYGEVNIHDMANIKIEEVED